MNIQELRDYRPDVIVVGAGNAALCAAISAHEKGARVLVLEAAPFEERGGNSHFTGGAFRFAYRGIEDLKEVCPAMTDAELENVDFGSYDESRFFDDMYELTEYRTDPELCEILVRSSLETAKWVARQGVKLEPGLGRQAYKVDGKFKFWGGLALHIWGGGPELLKALYANAARRGIPDRLRDAGHRVCCRRTARSPASPRVHKGRPCRDSRRRGHPGLRRLRVESGDARPLSRPRLGHGEGARHPLQHGRRPHDGAGVPARSPYGNWSGCHAVAWDINAPRYGDLAIGDQFQKHNYPFGIIVNARGERLRRRGRQLPQPYLREIRRRDPEAARHVRLAGFRCQGQPPVAQRVPHPPRHQGGSRHAGGTGGKSRRRRSRWASSRPCANSTRPAAPTSRSIPTCWTAAAPRGWRSTSPTGPIRSIRRRSMPIT